MTGPLEGVVMHADAMARAYVALTESLQREGVPESDARFDARSVVVDLVYRASMIDEPEPWEKGDA